MKDTCKVLRWAIFGLLDGQITLNGAIIPIGDEKIRAGDPNGLFVTFGTQQERNVSTDDAFITESAIDIEITQKTGYEVSKDDIDDVANLILDKIMPYPDTDILTTDQGFLIQNIQRLSSITRSMAVTDTESVVSKIITVSATIVQQFP